MYTKACGGWGGRAEGGGGKCEVIKKRSYWQCGGRKGWGIIGDYGDVEQRG